MEGTPASALEAAGAESVTFDFRGTTVTIPLAIERWPLADIRAGKVGRAIKALLGGQRPPMRTRADVTELSHRMADACGVTPLPEVPATERGVFGAVPTLLGVIDNHRDDLEADLLRFYGVDYRAPGAVTMRQVWVMIRRLPIESATLVARNGGELPWTRGEIIAAREWELWTRKRYPGRPPTKAEIDEWLAKRVQQADELDRMAEREEYYRSGQNMRDAGVEPGWTKPPKRAPRQRPQPANDPVDRALAVAMKNARRTPTGRSSNGTATDQRPGFRSGRWDTRGSGW